MLARRCYSFLLALLTLLTLSATAVLSSATASPFPCTGGSIYFTAQSIDTLLFQNPDLLHDLYVFKCVTTVIFTSDTGGEAANDTRVRELERGLEDAYRFMSGGSSFEGDGSRPISDMEEPGPSENTTTIRIGKYDVAASPVFGLSNVQIIYLRLPGSTYYGQGYVAYHEESLKRLYSADISHITTIDGTVTYSVRNLKGVIATILRQRRPDDVRVLNHLESLSTGDDDTQLEHADRIVSAKLVMDVIKEEEIEANVVAYASDAVRNLDNNLHTPDYIKKVNTFFEYAKHDPDTCQSLDECGDRLRNLDKTSEVYYEGNYFYEFLKREYYVT